MVQSLATRVVPRFLHVVSRLSRDDIFVYTSQKRKEAIGMDGDRRCIKDLFLNDFSEGEYIDHEKTSITTMHPIALFIDYSL